MIAPNAQVTAWYKCGAADRYGQPVRTVQSGGPWPVLAEPVNKTLDRAGRKVVATLKVHFTVAGKIPSVALGDILIIDSVEYEIVQVSPVNHPTLGRVSVLLA